MVPSKPPKDVLELGKYLVRELDFEDGVDTLGRWMAHHLAELIHEAENCKTLEKRLEASQQATETILKIWEHRKVLPREAYPLAKYKDLLKVIDRLRIDNNPYRFYRYDSDSIDEIASMLFDNFTRLVLTLLLMKIEVLESQKTVDDVVIEHLNEEEKQVWLAIQEWMVIFPVDSNQDKSLKKSKKGKPIKFDLAKNSLAIVDTLINLISELQEKLKT